MGRLLKTIAFLFLFPSIIALIYGEYYNLVAFLPIGVGLFLIGFLCSLKEPNNKHLTAIEGFVIVAASWVIISLAVAFSFLILGEVSKKFIDCFFEAVSGFTTTGASIVSDVESLSKSTNALRLGTHWVGGMGILVLVLAIIPKNVDATAMNVFRAEVPGHQVEKMTSKLAVTAKVLYLIYAGITIILAIAFMIAKMPIYDSIVHAMSIAGTGGFSVRNASIGAYNSAAIEIIATVGMFLFGVNMNIFYLILMGKVLTAFKSEELRTYVLIYLACIFLSAGSLVINSTYDTFGESLRHSAFQLAAIMSTTGMSVENFSTWPVLCQMLIFVTMFIGGCSGSTAGGMKLSRVIIAGKYVNKQIRLSARPNVVKTIRLEGERVEKDTVNGALSYVILYFAIIILSFVFIAFFEGIINGSGFTFFEQFTAVLSAISNVGPAFGRLAVGTYGDFSWVSKLILIFDMLAGRLEILPMIFIFNPFLWKRGVIGNKKRVKNSKKI